MLFSPHTHEPLTDEAWDAERVRARIQAVVDDAEAAFDPVALWPATEGWDTRGDPRLPLTRLYAGAAGVVWALETLRRRGHADVRIDLAATARRALEKWRADPDMPERREPPVNTRSSLFFGESGILLVHALVAPDDDVAEDLLALVRANRDCETNELMGGSPGTMLAAKAMLDRTGDERWADAWRDSAEELWRRRYLDGFWTYPPYGKAPGASHGLATNASILLQGGDLVPADRRERLRTESSEALARAAVREDGLANWSMAVEDCGELEWMGEIRLQWCHGGAGVVASAAEYLDEELLLAGAELVWLAGPGSMEKGPGICHGTAGNGYALLRTFGRSGEEQWLERARGFAVHALDQVDRARAERGGRGRYSLWTGDLGAAVFAADCLDANPAVPILDYV